MRWFLFEVENHLGKEGGYMNIVKVDVLRFKNLLMKEMMFYL